MWWFLPLVLADECTLIQDDAGKPYPSLVKCYRYNSEACCVSAHDQEIGNAYGELLSEQCQRQYNPLEDYFCYGCNPEQGEYINHTSKVIRICESLAENVWGESLDKSTTAYDNCGMYTYWRGSNSSTVIPSKEWSNAYDFFKEVKPPYFEDYEIQIVTEGDDCFSKAEYLGVCVVLGLMLN